MIFHVPDMSCGHCTAAITESVLKRDPSARVQTDLDGRRVTVETSAPEADIIQAMKDAGYEASPA